ncbi:MAG: HAMP domain-containing protein [Chloroflexota bacterium]|nr:MAG: HAMP domain-containing protein [Chloroflexota bacterium]
MSDRQAAPNRRATVRPILRWNLHRKLLALSLCIVLPLMVFSYFLVQENVVATKRQILNNSAATADLVAYQVDDFAQSTKKLLETLAATESLRARHEQDANLLLVNTVVIHEDYKIIFASDENGVIFANGITKGILYDNVTSRDYFATVITRKEATISGRLPSQVGDEPVVNIVVPIRSSTGAVVGSVGAGVSLTGLRRRLTSSQITAHQATVMVVDNAGTALVHPEWQYVLNETSLRSLPPVRAGLTGARRGTIEYRDPIFKETYLAAYAHALVADWTVVVAYPANLAYLPVQDAAFKGLIGLSVTAIGALLVALFFMLQVTRPIGELSKKAKAMVDSLTSGLPESRSGDEVQQLAQAIDVMSSDIRLRSDELVRTRREIDQKVQELRSLASRVAIAQEEERKRLALDMHDGLAQLVFGALFQAQAMEEYIAPDQEAARRRLHATEQLLDQAVVEVKRVLAEMRPTKLDGGLVGALQRNLASLDEVFGLRCHLSVRGPVCALSNEVEIATFRIVQEALNNVRKHAQANKVDVTVTYEPSTLEIAVEDDGRGFDMKAAESITASGLGILGMCERADRLGGTLDVRSWPGEGTVIRLELPTNDRKGALVFWPRVEIHNRST